MPNEHQLKPESDPALENVEDLVSVARDYFSTDFPNVARIECPRNEIEGVINSSRLPQDRLREHILSCSNCFRSYQQTLSARQPDRITLLSPWKRFLVSARQPQFVVACVVLIFILASVAVIYVRRGEQPGSVVAENKSTGSPSESVTEHSRDLLSQNANNSVEIHFDEYHLRGDKNAEETPAEARRGPAQFMITLPQGSPVGEYSVFLVDAFDKTVRKTTSQSPDGKMLVVKLDLGKLPYDRYRLCLSWQAEARNCKLVFLK